MQNGYISIQLKDLLASLDARIDISIFLLEHKKIISFYGPLKEAPLYEILTDKEFTGTYGDYKVTGISYTPGRINIQIDTEEEQS